MSDRQLEFDFEQYPEPRRVSAPVTEYFRKAFTPPTAEEVAMATDVAERAIKAQTVASTAKTLGLEIIADPNMQRHQVAYVSKGKIDVQPLGAPCEPTVYGPTSFVPGFERLETDPPADSEIPQTYAPILSQESEERKNTPIFSGVLMYFPLAIAAVARHSKRGNDKHNAGEPLHWAREKSDDHADCISRHLVDVDHYNAEIGEYEEACALAWRALAKLQLLEEKRLGRSK